MGEIADMMIEAEINGGVTDEGIIIDLETGEFLGLEEHEEPRDWKKMDAQRMNGYVERLRLQGFHVQRISDYHILVNNILEIWHGKNGTSSRRKGGKMVYSKTRSQGVINTAHRFFKYSPSRS